MKLTTFFNLKVYKDRHTREYGLVVRLFGLDLALLSHWKPADWRLLSLDLIAPREGVLLLATVGPFGLFVGRTEALYL